MADSIRSTFLWSNPDRTRFFMVPDDAPLPAGDFVLQTITGRKLSIDPVAASTFEITEDEAKQWLESQLGNMLDSARGAVERFVDRLAGGDQGPLAPVRNAIETLESALKRYAFSHYSETHRDVHALLDYAKRVGGIVEQMRSLARG